MYAIKERIKSDVYGNEVSMYEKFAGIYDILMEETPYDEWAEAIIGILKQYGINEGIVADLGCGTGSITGRLAVAGYDMIGIDSSEEMLGIARQYEEGNNILYLQQDICEFELYGTVRALISTCDTINYITDTEDLIRLFKLAANYLESDGVFIFDIKTLYTYNKILGMNTFAWNIEEGSVIWENCFDEQTKLNQYELTMYLAEDRQLHGEEVYCRYEETHLQRAYTEEEIIKCAEAAGLKIVSVTDAYTGNALKEDSERASYILIPCPDK